MTEYGYMENGYLRSRILEPYTEIRTDENGVQHNVVISVAEQARALSKEWKPVDPIDPDQMEAPEGFVVVANPYDAGDHIAYRYEMKPDKQAVQAQIQALKDSLDNSDYKVAKCYEAQIMGAEMPYDIKALIAERQAARDKINELEARL